MKLQDLTAEQRKAIEDDEIGRRLIDIDEGFVNMTFTIYAIRKNTLHEELKRTIKRIDEEIEFLKCLNDETMSINVIDKKINREMDLLYKKELYTLMEKLE